jgi:hypothetical protein
MRGETPILLGPLEGANLNHWTRLALSKGPNRVGVSPLTWERNRSGFRNAVCSSSYNTGRWAKPKIPVILSVMYHPQNPLGSNYIFYAYSRILHNSRSSQLPAGSKAKPKQRLWHREGWFRLSHTSKAEVVEKNSRNTTCVRSNYFCVVRLRTKTTEFLST